jgi:nucleoside triphosphate diphosphatase
MSERNEGKPTNRSIMSGLAQGDSAIELALDIQDKAASHGFDWPEVGPVFDKIIEELNELKQELAKAEGQNQDALPTELREAISAEFGDVLFSCLNLSRFVGVSPQYALQKTNTKFISRFQHIERVLAERGEQVNEVSLTQLDHLWDQAKLLEKNNS